MVGFDPPLSSREPHRGEIHWTGSAAFHSPPEPEQGWEKFWAHGQSYPKLDPPYEHIGPEF